MDLLFKDLTYQIRGCIYEVQNTLRFGFDEETYHIALGLKLEKAGIPFKYKLTDTLQHRGVPVHKFQLDLLVDDKVILELKDLQTDFHPVHLKQLLTYQKFWQKGLGLLVNFGLPKVKIKRVIFEEVAPIIKEYYEDIKPLINQQNRENLKDIRTIIFDVLGQYGLGYNSKVYQKIFEVELDHLGVEKQSNVIIPVTYEQKAIREYEIPYPIIEQQILCGIVALQKEVRLDIIKVQTYLKMLNLPLGLLINFGKKELQIFGIRP